MALPRETIHLGASPSYCGVRLPIKVLQSATRPRPPWTATTTDAANEKGESERLPHFPNKEPEMTEIKGFFGQYRFLSNFWPAPINVNGKTYPTSEHAYQALKTTNDQDHERIRLCQTPAESKKLVRSMKANPQWDAVKLEVMEQLIRAKFTQNPSLAANLKATGSAHLEETNTWNDTFWGVCNGKGKNHLGQILMKIRSELP